MMKAGVILLIASIASGLSAQTNYVCTNLAAEQVMLGNFSPAAYAASNPVTDPGIISQGINAGVSADSMHAYLEALATFHTRNSGSDTVSATHGIGAARSWILKKFKQFSAQNENRLVPFYLQFDQDICGITRHKDVCAVLPGTDISLKDFILIEGHFDSRCAGLCDTSCAAHGMEDNGSGTVLVMELARVLSKYSFRRSIVFMATTAEEQGLLGARAFATYAQMKNMKIRAVLNNDVIGGVICGNTSSPPSCPGSGDIDSLHVRLFSSGAYNSPHKQLARFIKLEYAELIRPLATVPMTLHVMTPEDRTGRSGDHIPFREKGFTAMRFTSANEHGHANPAAAGYHDRQHTSSDILGVDTDSDMQLDSFFVDFNYLARNAVINANAAAMAAMGPKTPQFAIHSEGYDLHVTITKELQLPGYRLALRTITNDWDTVFSPKPGPNFVIPVSNNQYIASVAAIDDKNVESLFSDEQIISVLGSVKGGSAGRLPLELMQNRPNPYDEATTISVLVNAVVKGTVAYISIKDEAGRELQRLPVALKPGMNDVEFSHGYHAAGTYIYTLVIDGKDYATRKMVLAE